MNKTRRSIKAVSRAVLRGGMLVAGASLLIACGPKPSAKDPNTGNVIKTGGGEAVSQVAANRFKDAMTELKKHDGANDWTEASCASTAAMFSEAAKEQDGKFLEALYNAGLSYQRCKKDQEAKAIFADLLKKNPSFHRARVQVALYDFRESGGKGVEKAIAEMERAIKDAEFKNVEALVNLASLQMSRDGDQGQRGCKDDFACAKLNLQRALAINDAFMPAFNQLAIYYLESAKKKAGRKIRGKRGRISAASSRRKRADSQALELAALVCSQALRKNPRYAPVFNTQGLISYELGDLSAAARAFGRARKLDPLFFDAHINFAAVNQKFRGFKNAEDGYRQALKLKPNDYEAHLGLALALRGQINDVNFDQMLAESTKELEIAKKLAPERAETYYNLAILTQEFKAREGGVKGEAVLKQAKVMYDDFIKKAGGDKAYADGVKRAKERMEEIDQIIQFNEESRRQQKEMEELQRKAKEAAAKKKAEDEAAAKEAAAKKDAAPAADAAAPAAPAGGDAAKPAAPAPAPK